MCGAIFIGLVDPRQLCVPNRNLCSDKENPAPHDTGSDSLGNTFRYRMSRYKPKSGWQHLARGQKQESDQY